MVAIVGIVYSMSARAQPFDTLLLQHNWIAEVYPLADQTFIIVGGLDDIKVERIDSKANVLWSTSLTSTEEDVFAGFQVNLGDQDSAIQIITSYKYCDAYYRNTANIFTLNFKGEILDAHYVHSNESPQFYKLLSGLPGRPRAAYFDAKHVVLLHASGDTSHLRLNVPGADSSVNALNYPEVISICPSGRIQVGSVFILISFDLVGDKYQFADAEFWHRGKQMMCIHDSSYITVNTDQHNFSLWNNGIREFFKPFPKYASIWPYGIRWLNDLISIHVHGYDEGDSLFLISPDGLWSGSYGFSEGFDDFTVDTAAHTAYFFSGGYHYLEGGYLGSVHLETGEGPQYHDVEIAAVQPGSYSDVILTWTWGGIYFYRIPSTTVSITNHGDFKVNELNLVTQGPYSFCQDTHVIRTLSNMQLEPGSTNTYEVNDLFAWRSRQQEKANMCVYIMAPDKHRDDDFSNNDFCFSPVLLPIQPLDPVNSIGHLPAIITDEVSFFGPQPMNFILEIIDMKGMIHFKGEMDTYNNNDVHCSGFPPGMYLFRYTLPATNAVFSEKIVKI